MAAAETGRSHPADFNLSIIVRTDPRKHGKGPKQARYHVIYKYNEGGTGHEKKIKRAQYAKCRLGQRMRMRNEKKGYMQEMETKRKSRPMDSGLLVQKKSDMQSDMRVWTTPIHKGIWESERNARGQDPRQRGEVVEKNQSSEVSCRVKAKGGV